MKIHNFDQRSDEWLKIRLGKFTATNGQAVATAGKGLETLCYEKASEIMFGVPAKENYTNLDLERGVEQEELAVAKYEIQTKNKVEKIGFVEMNEMVGCSPDGFVGEEGLIEIKCKNNPLFVKCLYTQEIDSEYMWQVQFQMLVTGREWVDFVVFNENYSDLIIHRVKKDLVKITKIDNGLAIGQAKVKEILERIKNGK